MKRIIFALLILPFFVACNQKEIKQLKEDNLQLTNVANQKEVAINDFVATLNSIEENLDIIKEKEKIVLVNSENPDKSQKQKISSTLNSINNILEQNRLKVAELDKKLKNSWYQNSKLRKLTTRLKTDIAKKEADIIILKEQIADLDIKVDGLTTEVENLNTSVTDLSAQNAESAKTIEEKTNNLNTAYYVIGSSSELKLKQIITKRGGIIGIGSATVLNENFDSKEFKQIDIRETALIPITGEKVELVTTHPLNSFKFEVGKGLAIIDAEQFWKSSKYLVVKVR
ncbi:Cbp1 family collagen-binding glycoprotein adhesin [Ancylomarina sp. YFZ004]